MPMVTVPNYIVRGTVIQRKRKMTRRWIGEKNNVCEECGVGLCWKQYVKTKGLDEPKKIRMRNLHMHHEDPETPVTWKERLANLYVPTPNKPDVQRRVLEEWVDNLNTCRLLCHSCHQRYHRNKSVCWLDRGAFQLACIRL